MNDYRTLDNARKEALEQSKANPTKYYTLFAAFGVFIDEKKRLHVNDPSDSFHHSYFKAGKEKKFTTAQIIADQIATPYMS